MAINERFARRPRRGMIVRSREVLEPGLTLFKLGHRFNGSKRQSDREVISSPWWFSSGTIEEIARAAAAADEKLSDVFRRFGAVAKRWGGSGDLIVKAIIAQPLVAYIGPGTVQDFRADDKERRNNQWDMPLWVPSPNAAQVCVPLVARSDDGVEKVNLATQAFRDVFLVPVDKWQDGYLRSNPDSKWASN